MKIICTTENLSKGVNLVSKISTTRGSLPILSNILLKAENGKITFSATDLELGIKTNISGKVELDGSITIPARLLNEFVNSCNDDQITIELEGDSVKFSSERYTAHLNGLDASEFPLIPEIKGSPMVVFSSEKLRDGLFQVAFAASRDETRPVLTGINFILENYQAKLVATDSYRLVEKTITVDKPISTMTTVIVPVNTILEVLRVIMPEDDEIKIYANDNQVMFGIGKTIIVSRLVEGKFPEYEQIIPKSYHTTCLINKDEIIQALKVTNLFARESANNVRLKILEKNLELVAIAPQVGDNTAKLNAETKGDPMEISFNTKYLLDALSQIKEDRVVLSTNKPAEGSERTDPGMFKGEKNNDYRSIIMPLRMEE